MVSIPDWPTEAALLRAEVALLAGEFDAALRECSMAFDVGQPDWIRSRSIGLQARILVAKGDSSKAADTYEQWRTIWRAGTLVSVTGTSEAVSHIGDALCELADRSFVEEILSYFGRYPAMRSFRFTLCNPDHMRGALALALDRTSDAQGYFQAGLEWASRPDVRFVVDQGRCLQGLAEVAERRGDIETGRAHLDAAGQLFAQHGGAKLYLDQVLAKQQVLKA